MKRIATDSTETGETTDDSPAYPAVRPRIVITPVDEPSFAVVCPELRYWSIIPCVGERASFADYQLPGWALAEVTELHALRPARVHDVEGVEIEVRRGKPESGQQSAWTMYGRLIDQKAQYLAIVAPNSVDGSAGSDGEQHTRVWTFLDDGFDWDWGEMNQAIEDCGRFGTDADGVLRTAADPAADGADNDPVARPEANGAGVFRVEIGGKTFTCLRLLDMPPNVEKDGSSSPMTESYVTREGRIVLTRHYCTPDFPTRTQLPIIVDEATRLVIDDIPWLHWYDTVTRLAL